MHSDETRTSPPAVQDTPRPDPGMVEDDKLLGVAKVNLRRFVESAGFKYPTDQQAALSCLDVIEAALSTAKPVTYSPEELRQMAADAMRKDGVTQAVMTITPTGVSTTFSYDPQPVAPVQEGEVVEALRTLVDKVDRFNGVFSGGGLTGRMQGEMWHAMKAGQRALAALPTPKESEK